jgi:hypothetical protein
MSATAAGHPAFWSLGLSIMSVLYHSQSIGRARAYLTFTSPSTTASELHTCAPQVKKHVTQPKVPKLNPKTQITLTITHHKSEPQGYISTLCSQLLLLFSMSNPFFQASMFGSSGSKGSSSWRPCSHEGTGTWNENENLKCYFITRECKCSRFRNVDVLGTWNMGCLKLILFWR